AGASITVDGQPYDASATYGPGTYTVVATAANGNNNGNCTASTTVTITEPVLLTAALSRVGSGPVCNGGTVILQVATTGALPLTVTLSDNSTHTITSATQNITRTPSVGSTTYTITAMSNAVCSAASGDLTGSVAVTVNARPTASISGTTTICNGTSTDLTVSFTGAGPWTYAINGGTALTASSSPATVSVSPSATTTYELSSLSDANCSAIAGDMTGSAAVTVDPVSVAGTISGAGTYCQGSTVTLTLSGNTGTIQWQSLSGGTWSDITGATSATYTYTIGAAGDYRAVVTSGVCSSVTTATSTVSMDPTPVSGTVSQSGTGTYCQGTSITLTVSGNNGDIQWQSFTGGNWADIEEENGQTYTFSAGSVGGTFPYRAMINTGTGQCSAAPTNTVNVVVNTTSNAGTITPSYGTPGVCSGAVVTLTSGSVNATSYNWQRQSGTSWVNVGTANAATYTYTATATETYRIAATNGVCPEVYSQSPQTVQVSNIVTNISSTNVTCYGAANGTATVAPTGGAGTTYSYVWTPFTTPRTTAAITNLTPGTYNVTITDASGCTRTASATITQPAPLNLSASRTNVFCFGGSNGTANASASGGTSPYTYTWSKGGTVIATQGPRTTTSSVTNLTAGNYTVVVSDANGCTRSLSISITQPSQITVTFTNVTQTSAKANRNGGNTGSTTYRWTASSPTGTPVSTAQTPTNLVANTLYFCRVTDNKSCTGSGFVTTLQAVGARAVDQSGNTSSVDLAKAVLYPNPTNGQFTLDFEAKDGLRYAWRVADLSGRIVAYQEDVTDFGLNRVMYNLENMTPGVYLMSLEMDGQSRVFRIVLQ
ncbi:MAG: T9SS type A sorting domain-containing protein, partial [Bacteroidota bacterium]